MATTCLAGTFRGSTSRQEKLPRHGAASCGAVTAHGGRSQRTGWWGAAGPAGSAEEPSPRYQRTLHGESSRQPYLR